MHTATLWMTPRGLRKLRHERADMECWLDRLRQHLTREKAARAAESSCTKAETSILAHRLELLDTLLGRAQTVPEGWGHKDEVRAGDTVYLRHGDSIRAVTLANVWDADPLHGRVSVLSPIGQALLGRRTSGRVNLASLDGQVLYEILKII
jgi:transcription elongation GreA/GreB family factor